MRAVKGSCLEIWWTIEDSVCKDKRRSNGASISICLCCIGMYGVACTVCGIGLKLAPLTIGKVRYLIHSLDLHSLFPHCFTEVRRHMVIEHNFRDMFIRLIFHSSFNTEAHKM